MSEHEPSSTPGSAHSEPGTSPRRPQSHRWHCPWCLCRSIYQIWWDLGFTLPKNEKTGEIMLCFFAPDAGTATSTYGSGNRTKQPRIWSTRSGNCRFGSPTFDEMVQVGPLSDQHVGAREVVASQMGTPNGQVTIGPPPPPTFGPLCNQWSERLVAKVTSALGLEHVICKCYALNYYRICPTAFMMRCAESRAYFPSHVCGCRDRRTSLHLYPTTNLTTWIWGDALRDPPRGGEKPI